MADELSRGRFLGYGAGIAALAGSPALASAAPPIASDTDLPRVSRALVLSGGGARGAYQAGLIDALATAANVAEGSPLPGYGIVCGTSIGALNGYFVATGQYRLLRQLWSQIAQRGVVRLKPQFAKLPNPDSGVGSRLWQALHLASGLNNNVRGIFDGVHLREWLTGYIDPSKPVVTPLVWAVTNLTTQQPEFFALVPQMPTPEIHAAAVRALAATVGPDAVLRIATPDLLIDALRGSAAIPVAFDPVVLPGPNEEPNDYVDGGVIANTPVAVARACAKAIDVVFLDPIQESYPSNNAVEIATGVFSAMQRRILEADLRAAYFETFGKRMLSGVTSDAVLASALHQDIRTVRAFAKRLYDVDVNEVRPTAELPVGVIGFDDVENIAKTYTLGFEAANTGFTPYTT